MDVMAPTNDILGGTPTVEPGGTEPAEQIEGSQTAPPEGQEAAEDRTQEPQFMTVEEYDRRQKESEERLVKRLKDSTRDQVSTQIAARLAAYNESVALSERAGVKVPVEDQAKVRQGIVNDTLAGAAQPQGQAAALTDESWANYVVSQVNRVFERVGTDVRQGDPEFAAVQRAYQDPTFGIADLLEVVRESAVAKKERLAKIKGSAGARVVQGNGKSISPGDISQINDPATLYNLGEQELRRGKS